MAHVWFSRWLFECAKSQRLVGVESHLVTCQTSEPTPPQTDAASQHRRQLDQHLPNLEDDRVDDRGREDEVKGQDGGGESEEGGERDGGGGDEAEPPLRGVVVCFNKKLASSSSE